MLPSSYPAHYRCSLGFWKEHGLRWTAECGSSAFSDLWSHLLCSWLGVYPGLRHTPVVQHSVDTQQIPVTWLRNSFGTEHPLPGIFIYLQTCIASLQLDLKLCVAKGKVICVYEDTARFGFRFPRLLLDSFPIVTAMSMAVLNYSYKTPRALHF